MISLIEEDKREAALAHDKDHHEDDKDDGERQKVAMHKACEAACDEEQQWKHCAPRERKHQDGSVGARTRGRA